MSKEYDFSRRELREAIKSVKDRYRKQIKALNAQFGLNIKLLRSLPYETVCSLYRFVNNEQVSSSDRVEFANFVNETYDKAKKDAKERRSYRVGTMVGIPMSVLSFVAGSAFAALASIPAALLFFGGGGLYALGAIDSIVKAKANALKSTTDKIDESLENFNKYETATEPEKQYSNESAQSITTDKESSREIIRNVSLKLQQYYRHIIDSKEEISDIEKLAIEKFINKNKAVIASDGILSLLSEQILTLCCADKDLSNTIEDNEENE